MTELESMQPLGVKTFTRKLNIIKENYHGTNYEGNECSKILKNINLLKQCLVMTEKTSDIVNTLEHVKSFISACCGTKPKDNWEETIDVLSEAWSDLHAKHTISITNKIHIIQSHVKDYISLTGKGLGKVCDQIVESCHSALNKRLVASGYHRKNLEGDSQGEMLFRGVLHFNSYNI